MTWSKDSWNNFVALQQPQYPDLELLERCKEELSLMPPLVFAGEARNLKKDLAKAVRGEAFLLQGGDCAESFSDFSAKNIKDLFKLFLQMALVLSFGSGKPIIKLARMAGQYAKPRSSDTEVVDGVELPSYRGDIINGFEFSEAARRPNPKLMLKAYANSASTLNLLRAFARGGMADLEKVHRWNLDFVHREDIDAKYEAITKDLDKCMRFLHALGLNSENTPSLQETRLYTSHEALLLPYEEALTRQDSTSGDFYDCSAHMLWIGERTRQLDGAHVHFLSGVKNPVGVKLGPDASKDDLMGLCQKLNPQNEAGRLNIIIRMGADKIKERLPGLLQSVAGEGLNVLYSIDPMHGNTIKAGCYKTREFEAILSETKSFFEIANACGVVPGGVHFEMTGKQVTECMGGSTGLGEDDLSRRYETQCDPRLNSDQALELAFLVGDLIKQCKI